MEEVVKVVLPGGMETAELMADQPGNCGDAIVANGIMENRTGWSVMWSGKDVSDHPIAKYGGKTISVVPTPGEGGCK